MPTLLQINVVANYGSTGHIAEEIGNLAIKLGWKSYIAYGRLANDSNSTLIKIGNKNAIRIHGIQTLLFDNHGLSSRKETERFIKKIEEVRPDIIHLHNIHGYYLNYRILFEYLSTIETPIVWTLHDCWLYTGHCAYYSFLNCMKWQTLCMNCPAKHAYPRSLFLSRATQNYKDKQVAFTSISNKRMTVVPVSNWLEKELKQSFLNKYNIEVIHNGIDIDIYKPSTIDKSIYGIDNRFVILGVANVWDNRKGFSDFLKLSKKISSDMVIVLVGLSKKQIASLPNNIIGISRTESQQQLVELYSLANVFVNLTWEDNYPTVNLEAIACGTPAITYNTGGSPESITPDTGFVVEQGNLEKVCDIINMIKKQGKEQYSQKCREFAVGNFNAKDRYKEYADLYTKMLSNI
jgi:glycosyltransferase involved in cell wall biosynthesis